MDFYNIDLEKIDGTKIKMSQYKGKVLLIVNTASTCGFTPQYDGLEALYKKYKDEGLVILGFPCNQFANQESKENKEIANFCSMRGVTFPMFAKIDVRGKNQHELYRFLTGKAKGLFGGAIKWNFTKFLISKDGSDIRRFAPRYVPEKMEKDILEFLSLSEAKH